MGLLASGSPVILLEPVAGQGTLLLQVEEARAIEMRDDRRDPRMLVLLESLRTNLFRLWSDA
jgi:hypothetical protein